MPQKPASKKQAPKKLHFTDARVAALDPPRKAKRDYHYDDEVRGLAVAIARGGKKVFLLYRTVNGRPERIKIGNVCDLNVKKARELAQQMNVAIIEGENPAADRREVRDEMTFEALFQKWLEEFSKVRKRTWKQDEWTFNKYLQSLRFRKISDIRRSDVITLHAHIGRTHGPYMANRIVELLSSIFNRARKDWGWKGQNPASQIDPFPERKRKRFLEASELPAFFTSLAAELNTTIRDYILVSLLTGARRANVQAMEWREINWHTKTWTVPASKAKADEELRIVLVPEVMSILVQRKADSESRWVFPGKGISGHLQEPKTCWKRILERAGLSDLRLHDLRRTLGSWQAATGASLPIIGKSLGHQSLEATQVYAQLDLDPVRESVNRATQALLLAGKNPLLLDS